MNKYIVSVVASLVMVSLLGSVAQAATVDSDWSFDSLYNNVIKQNKFLNKETQSPIQETAVTSTNQATVKTATKPVVGKRTYVVAMTAYSSTPDQTDSTPFITAWNTHVRDGIVAANFLSFGTAIKIPDLFGDKIFIVEDRMNKRYTERVDVWFPDRESALQFGLKRARIEVI